VYCVSASKLHDLTDLEIHWLYVACFTLRREETAGREYRHVPTDSHFQLPPSTTHTDIQYKCRSICWCRTAASSDERVLQAKARPGQARFWPATKDRLLCGSEKAVWFKLLNCSISDSSSSTFVPKSFAVRYSTSTRTVE
jgi:hypothetical protein